MPNSVNLFLLSLFAQTIRIGKDNEHYLRRYQIMSIIYINLCVALIVAIWNTAAMLGVPLPCRIMNSTIIPLLITSFAFLKWGSQDKAAIIILGYFHLTIFVISKVSNGSLSGVAILLACPPFAFFLTSSKRLHLVNLIICALQYVNLVFDIRKLFKVTFTNDQAAAVFQMQASAFLSLCLTGCLSYFSKEIETNLWEIAQSNLERTEKINKEVLQAIEAKDTFVSSLSHEIRNPLNAMKGSIDYLLGVIKDAAHRQILEHAHLSSEVLLNLLNNVLDAAKLKSDKMELAFSETGFIDMVKKVAVIYSERLREKELCTQIMLDKKIPPTLWVDSSRLLQIMTNLFSNAIKFTPKKGKIRFFVSWCSAADMRHETRDILLKPEENTAHEKSYDLPTNNTDSLSTEESGPPTSRSFAEFNRTEAKVRADNVKRTFEPKRLGEVITRSIELTKRYVIWNIHGKNAINTQQLIDAYSFVPKPAPNAAAQTGYLKVQLTDTGPGIANEHIPNLFEMFSQGGRNINSVYGGSGLGLWISKQLCQKMGGDITLYTKVNKGTTFIFYVPINNENINSHSDFPKVDRVVSLKEKRVRALVVDDYAYNRDIHRLLLEREGVQVSVACNGKEALDKYTEQPEGFYDFVMMDVQMPEMDGFTSGKLMREWEDKNKWNKIDIYFVSGEYYNEAEIMAELRAKGKMSEASGVRCLRKPIEVEMFRKIVERYAHAKQQPCDENQIE